MTKHTPGASRSLVSKDGRALYFSSGSVLWRYDIASRTVSAPHAVSAPIVGLGVSDDGQRLYVASEGERLIILQLRSGQAFDVATGGISGVPRLHQVVDASYD